MMCDVLTCGCVMCGVLYVMMTHQPAPAPTACRMPRNSTSPPASHKSAACHQLGRPQAMYNSLQCRSRCSAALLAIELHCVTRRLLAHTSLRPQHTLLPTKEANNPPGSRAPWRLLCVHVRSPKKYAELSSFHQMEANIDVVHQPVMNTGLMQTSNGYSAGQY